LITEVDRSDLWREVCDPHRRHGLSSIRIRDVRVFLEPAVGESRKIHAIGGRSALAAEDGLLLDERLVDGQMRH